jgi:hypothetical protein
MNGICKISGTLIKDKSHESWPLKKEKRCKLKGEEKIRCEPAEKFKQLGTWALKGVVIVALPSLVRTSPRRNTAETAPSPWLAGCSASRSYLLTFEVCCHEGLRALST